MKVPTNREITSLARQIAALWLHEVYGLTYEQIAGIMHITAGAAKSLIFRIRHNEDFIAKFPESMRGQIRRRTIRYDKSMDGKVVRKF